MKIGEETLPLFCFYRGFIYASVGTRSQVRRLFDRGCADYEIKEIPDPLSATEMADTGLTDTAWQADVVVRMYQAVKNFPGGPAGVLFRHHIPARGVKASSWERNDCYYCEKNMGCGDHTFVNIQGKMDNQHCRDCQSAFLSDLDRELARREKEADQAGLCKFQLAWRGRCASRATENGFCARHAKEKCVECGGQATRECSMAGSLVCGKPVCDQHDDHRLHAFS